MTDNSQRDAILDAFEGQINAEGTRGATLDAIARKVGLSRSGLLHHFRSRQDLVAGLIARLDILVDRDVDKMMHDPERAVEYYIATSLNLSDPVERCVRAVSILATDLDPLAREALRRSRDKWYAALVDSGRAPAVARLAMFVGDGMSYNLAMAGDDPSLDPFVGSEAIQEVFDVILERARNHDPKWPTLQA